MSKTFDELLFEFVNASVDDALKITALDNEAKAEQAKQQKLEDEMVALSGGKQKDVTEKDGAPTRSDEPVPSLDKQPNDEYTSDPDVTNDPSAEAIRPESFIDKFNIIRSGKSMNDRAVEDAIRSITDKLSDDKKKFLYGFLKQVGSIVAPTQDLDRLAPPPDDEDKNPELKTKRLQMLQKRRADREDAADRRDAAAQSARGSDIPPPEPQVKTPVVDADEDENGPPIRVGKRNK